MGTSEPRELVAPAFQVMGAAAKASRGAAMGEPSLAADADGVLWLSFPGCERTPAFGKASCAQAPAYRSGDAGASWARLNRGQDSHLSSDPASFGNRDVDVAVDGRGTAYVVGLPEGGGVPVQKSDDGGASWSFMSNLLPQGAWADRPWIGAEGAGHVVAAWMGGPPQGAASVVVRATFDAAATWTPPQSLSDQIGWLGQVAFDPAGQRVYVPFTRLQQQDPAPGPPLPGTVGNFTSHLGKATYQLLVARSLDGGRAWDVVDTGARVTRSATGRHWPGTIMAPSLDVTGDGHIVVAWSEEVKDVLGAQGIAARVRWVASGDEGSTWTAPGEFAGRGSAIMPWVTGGAGDRFAVAFFATDVPLDTDYIGDWDVQAAVVDGAGAQAPVVVNAIVEAHVHQGGICARGDVCQPAASDRTLLDFFEADLMPDGRLAVAYPADPAGNAKGLEIRFAVQTGGTPLLER